MDNNTFCGASDRLKVIQNECLERVKNLLEENPVLNAETAETVKKLVETVIKIEVYEDKILFGYYSRRK